MWFFPRLNFFSINGNRFVLVIVINSIIIVITLLEMCKIYKRMQPENLWKFTGTIKRKYFEQTTLTKEIPEKIKSRKFRASDL